jgi:hypothetical protein
MVLQAEWENTCYTSFLTNGSIKLHEYQNSFVNTAAGLNSGLTTVDMIVVAVFGGVVELREGTATIVRGLDAGFVKHIIQNTSPDGVMQLRGGSFLGKVGQFLKPLGKVILKKGVNWGADRLKDGINSLIGDGYHTGSGMYVGQGLKVLN